MSKKVPLPPSSVETSSCAMGSVGSGAFRMEGFEPRKRKATTNSALEKAFNTSAREELHSHIA